MLNVFGRALILYLAVVFFIRMMGKRQIGELQPFELVITLLIADLVATPMQNIGISLVDGIIPVIVLFCIHTIISYIGMKNNAVRTLFFGHPSILVERGTVNEKELRKLSMSIPELMETLRLNGAFRIEDVWRATLETNGSVSIQFANISSAVTARDAHVQTKPDAAVMTVVVDGRLDMKNIQTLQLDVRKLRDALTQAGFERLDSIFYATVDELGALHIQWHGQSPQLVDTMVEVGA